MAISLKLRAPSSDIDSESFSLEASELAELLAIQQQETGTPVESPADAFELLGLMGYKRGDELDMDSRVKEFAFHLERMYWGSGNPDPTLDEVIDLMAYLGYTRPLV